MRSAAINRGTCVSGFSADVPVLMAILSASLSVPVGDDLVATGHVSSVQGDIAMVAGLPAKVSAALSDGSIRRLVHPAIDNDASLKALAPRQLEQAETSLRAARRRLQTTSVRDVGELVAAVFKDADAVFASLRNGFYDVAFLPDSFPNPIGRATQFFIVDNSRRFWSALERQLLEGDGDRARQLLRAFTAYHMDRSRYPAEYGRRLLELVHSLPPVLRRTRRLFPLISADDIIRLSQHAGEAHHEDVPLLFDAAAGRSVVRKPVPPPAAGPRNQVAPADAAEVTLDTIVAEISTETLAAKCDRPLDEARAVYRVSSTAVDTYEEFLDAVSSFYLHMQRHVGCVGRAVAPEAVAADAQDCLERAFVRSGGSTAAWAEAREPLRGGLSFIFNVLTHQLKNDLQSKHVRSVFKSIINPLDWDARVKLMAAFLRRLGPQLPQEIRAQPAERFARRYEPLVEAYVRSLDQLKSLLRCM